MLTQLFAYTRGSIPRRQMNMFDQGAHRYRFCDLTVLMLDRVQHSLRGDDVAVQVWHEKHVA